MHAYTFKPVLLLCQIHFNSWLCKMKSFLRLHPIVLISHVCWNYTISHWLMFILTIDVLFSIVSNKQGIIPMLLMRKCILWATNYIIPFVKKSPLPQAEWTAAVMRNRASAATCNTIFILSFILYSTRDIFYYKFNDTNFLKTGMYYIPIRTRPTASDITCSLWTACSTLKEATHA